MTRLWGFGIAAGAFFFLILVWTLKVEQTLGPSNFISGWAVFGVLVALVLFNGRKRLPFLPLASASWWFYFHITGGFLVVFLFWLHTDIIWPNSLYNQALVFMFYSVSITGIIGLFIEKTYPKSLTQSGVEYIYERIPERIAEIRAEAESVIEECTEKTGSDTLAKHYLEQNSLLNRYLNDDELAYSKKIFDLANTKRIMDFHYSMQRVLKGWLLVHVPLSTGLMVLALWHFVVVQVYL